MKKVVITGSTDGLGLMIATALIKQGHQVVLHARNHEKATRLKAKLPNAWDVVVGDLSSFEATTSVADQVNKLGHMDSVIHNAGVGYRESRLIKTKEGLPHVFAINSLAPYVLTCLIQPPERLIYTSSGLHNQGEPDLSDVKWQKRAWEGFQAYSDSTLHNILLAFGVARHWPNVYANALEPGWVATKMGGSSAPDSLTDAPKTQEWLAVSDDAQAKVSGKYFYHKALKSHLRAADDPQLQDAYLALCGEISGVRLPK
ncbi:NAD(P)-dependent dehydrogenase, short-chain alcohol dehydrogenase family [Catalinimonas alkaloidigena]|uniref:NAD(P)-dependent dehydrogenase, short-chain alcohol dehydrogenase family n=1 Tax=Catalinimonas alkaloidigena TaxID=1075417 RepID=A0A1G9TY13_9BACT|nr:SDR family NAD(P)-dependent oxidoreductase [Catalinimonas alkaloidigena]SDM52483.1 NAD(P)-dependent dehydrogenase, short-chain alcohol dehydrogenase family [Catalinimonas alkaloidigena]